MDALSPKLVKRAHNLDLPLAALTAMAQLKDELEALEYAAIRSAREKGASWADIAGALGVTRQALQQRVQRHETRSASPVVSLEGSDPATTLA